MQRNELFRKNFEFLETNITTPNGIVPLIFGYERTSGKKLTIEYKKDIYVLHIIISGKGFFNKIPVGENQAFILCPGNKDTYKPDTSDPWTYVWIEFTGTLVENYLNHCGFTKDNKILTLAEVDFILKQFKEIFYNVPKLLNKHARNMQFEAKAMNIFSSIVEQCGYLDRNKEKSSQLIVIESIMTFINSNYSDPNLTVNYLAKHFSYAPSYLTRLFKKYTNMSPVKYITQVKMEKAVELFTKGINATKVSSIIGYQNQFYFSKAFLKYYGVRPSVYIKENIKL